MKKNNNSEIYNTILNLITTAEFGESRNLSNGYTVTFDRNTKNGPMTIDIKLADSKGRNVHTIFTPFDEFIQTEFEDTAARIADIIKADIEGWEKVTANEDDEQTKKAAAAEDHKRMMEIFNR